MTPAPDSPPQNLRLGFAGTPDFAARILQALVDADRRPVVVYTQPDRPVGRGRKLRPSPVKALAETVDLPLRQPPSLRGAAAAEALAAWNLDVLVVAAYGLILPPTILDVPRFGCLNVHASLLPRWRGAAPVERAIMAGDTETGVCIMHMERGLDTGPVYLARRTAIRAEDDGPALERRLAALGAEALLDCLAQLPGLTPTPQPEDGVTYAHKLTRADSAIDWQRPALSIERQVRALCARLPAVTAAGDVRVTVLDARAEPTPGADAADAGNADAGPGTLLSAGPSGIRVRCGDGVLAITRLRLNVGKGSPLGAADAVNGYGHLFRPGLTLSTLDPT